MSRTIRRKHMKLPQWITHEHTYVWRDLGNGWQWREWGWLPLPKKEAAREKAKFYSDNTGSTKFFCSTNGRKDFILDFQNSERRNAKNELRKYMLDEDYEVMICQNRPFTDYWD